MTQQEAARSRQRRWRWKVCYDAVAGKYATIFALLIYTLIKAISLNVRWKAENNKSVGGGAWHKLRRTGTPTTTTTPTRTRTQTQTRMRTRTRTRTVKPTPTWMWMWLWMWSETKLPDWQWLPVTL